MEMSVGIPAGMGAALALAAVLNGVAPTGARPSESLEALVADYVAAHDFSGTVLVRRKGQDVFERSYGLANRAFAAPATNDTLYRIASITKLFTATMVLGLVDERRIELDAPVSRYLPHYAQNGAEAVPIRTLLNHTSGLRNVDTIGSYEEAAREGMPLYQLPHTSQALLEEVASRAPLRAPGAAFDYNNADYIVLGKVIEAVTGQGFELALQRRILAPLGLAHTGMCAQPRILAGLAETYFRPGAGAAFVNDLPVYFENWYAGAGMYSNARDLAWFADALFGGRLLKAETLALMLTPGLDGYGFGLWAWDIEAGGRRYRTAERFGASMGANGVVFQVVDEDITIIILANSNAADMRAFAVLIAQAVLEGAAR